MRTLKVLFTLVFATIFAFPVSNANADCSFSKIGTACTTNRATYTCTTEDGNREYTFECVCGKWDVIGEKHFGRLCDNPKGWTYHYTAAISTLTKRDGVCIPWISSDYVRYASEHRDDQLVANCGARSPRYKEDCVVPSYTYERTFAYSECEYGHSELIKEISCQQDSTYGFCGPDEDDDGIGDGPANDLYLTDNECTTRTWPRTPCS